MNIRSPREVKRRAQCCALAFGLLTAGTGCIGGLISPGAERPDQRSDLIASASTDIATVLPGASATLRGAAEGGSPPYQFRWSLNAGPAESLIVEDASDVVTTGPLLVEGLYQFRLTVTDDLGDSATDFVTVDVVDALAVDVPRLILVGERADLTASVDLPDAETSFLWEVVRGEAEIIHADSPEASLTAGTGETLKVLLTATITTDAGDPNVTSREFDVVATQSLMQPVLVETNFGGITIELDGQAAPLHAANFLQYVDETFYDGLLFHRNACSPNPDTDECEPFVLQGGGYERIDGELVKREPTQDPVASESGNGLTNGERHSIALALSGGDSNSGTTEFFINLADNSFLDDRNFTVFGRVIDGMDIVDEIARSETTESTVLGGEDSLPVADIVIERMIRIDP